MAVAEAMGFPVALRIVVPLVGRFSHLRVDLPEPAEVKINPLTVGPSGAVAVDAQAGLGR